MGFKVRKTVRLGPLRLHFTQRGFSSWGIKVGRLTWNARTGKTTVDTPGPGYYQTRGRQRGSKGH